MVGSFVIMFFICCSKVACSYVLFVTPFAVVLPSGASYGWIFTQYALSTILYTFTVLLNFLRRVGVYICTALPPILQPVSNNVGFAVIIFTAIGCVYFSSVDGGSVIAPITVLPLLSRTAGSLGEGAGRGVGVGAGRGTGAVVAETGADAATGVVVLVVVGAGVVVLVVVGAVVEGLTGGLGLATPPVAASSVFGAGLDAPTVGASPAHPSTLHALGQFVLILAICEAV